MKLLHVMAKENDTIKTSPSLENRDVRGRLANTIYKLDMDKRCSQGGNRSYILWQVERGGWESVISV